MCLCATRAPTVIPIRLSLPLDSRTRAMAKHRFSLRLVLISMGCIAAWLAVLRLVSSMRGPDLIAVSVCLLALVALPSWLAYVWSGIFPTGIERAMFTVLFFLSLAGLLIALCLPKVY